MKKDILRIFIKDIYGNGDKVEVNILNTKLEESTKKLFSESIEGSNFKITQVSPSEQESSCFSGNE